MKICPKCGKEHENPGSFCSRKCANSRIRTPEIKEKIRNSMNAFYEKNGMKSTGTSHICPQCNKTFLGSKNQKFCSSKCANIANRGKYFGLQKGRETMRLNGNLGGYREGSGRSKFGHYKGIFCGSTYELVWVIYQLDNNKPFSRFKGCLELNGVKYFPDFLQNGKIIELKGYWNKSVDLKSDIAKHFGFEISVLYKKDLVKEFEWVRTHYQYKTLEDLYDDKPPKYNYICTACGKPFSRRRPITSEHSCCSRKCAGILIGNLRKSRSANG